MRNIIIFSMVTFLMAFTSCHREVAPFLGDYSYKLSGEVAVTDAEGATSYHLLHRNGQMNILEDKANPSRLLITMNEMNGACYTMTATVKGDSLFVEPYEFNINILTQEGTSIFDSESTSSLVYRITSSGCGMLNGKMLVLDEQWNGYQSGDNRIGIAGPEMRIIAEKN